MLSQSREQVSKREVAINILTTKNHSATLSAIKELAKEIQWIIKSQYIDPPAKVNQHLRMN